jgi:hypothetical protein
MATFRERFNKAPPRTATLLDWEKRAFTLGCVKDRLPQKCGVLVKGESQFHAAAGKHSTTLMIWTGNQVIQIKLW